MILAGVGRFTPLIPGRQRQRPGRGSGRRGRPPGSGKRARIMGSSGNARDPAKSNPESEIGFLSPEMNKTSDTQLDLSLNGTDAPPICFFLNIYYLELCDVTAQNIRTVFRIHIWIKSNCIYSTNLDLIH